jgi:hypothetical protein
MGGCGVGFRNIFEKMGLTLQTQASQHSPIPVSFQSRGILEDSPINSNIISGIPKILGIDRERAGVYPVGWEGGVQARSVVATINTRVR